MTEIRTEVETAQLTNYGTFRTSDGDVVVYDRDNPDAWIQSDVAVLADEA